MPWEGAPWVGKQQYEWRHGLGSRPPSGAMGWGVRQTSWAYESLELEAVRNDHRDGLAGREPLQHDQLMWHHR